jgi:hypothetical protein
MGKMTKKQEERRAAKENDPRPRFIISEVVIGWLRNLLYLWRFYRGKVNEFIAARLMSLAIRFFIRAVRRFGRAVGVHPIDIAFSCSKVPGQKWLKYDLHFNHLPQGQPKPKVDPLAISPALGSLADAMKQEAERCRAIAERDTAEAREGGKDTPGQPQPPLKKKDLPGRDAVLVSLEAEWGKKNEREGQDGEKY